jgi:hypothetical protein
MSNYDHNPMHPPEMKPTEDTTEVDTSKMKGMTGMNKIYFMIHKKDPAERENGKERFANSDRYFERYGYISTNRKKFRDEIDKQVVKFLASVSEKKEVVAEILPKSNEKTHFAQLMFDVKNKNGQLLSDTKKENISPSQLLLERMAADDNGLKPEERTFLFNINYNSNLGKVGLPQTLLHAATRNCDEEMVEILLKLGKWLAPSLLVHHVYNKELTKIEDYPNMDAAYSTYCFMPGKTGRIQEKIREKMNELGITYTPSIGSSITILGRKLGGKSKHKRKTTNKTTNKTTKKHRKTSKKLRKTK